MSTRSPHRVEQLPFLLRRNLTVGSPEILERSGTLSLSKNQNLKPKLTFCTSRPATAQIWSFGGDEYYSQFCSYSHLFFSHNSTYIPLCHYFDFSTQWHHAMCQCGSHLELKLAKLELDMWHPMCHSKMRQVSCPTLVSSKNVQISTVSEFDVVARFRETIPTVKSVSSSET